MQPPHFHASYNPNNLQIHICMASTKLWQVLYAKGTLPNYFFKISFIMALSLGPLLLASSQK